MNYRPFGRTGLEVSEVGFGCGRTGGLLIDGPEEDARRAVRAALDGGINWFDTAETYGNGKSEEALGRLLEEVEETPFVSTKVTLDPEAGDLAGQVEDRLAGSLKRLRRDRVDLVQLHNRIDPGAGGRALDLDRLLGSGEAADGLARVKEAGLARFVGLTALGDADAVQAAIESGRFDSAQVFYNMVNPSAARPMPKAWTGQRLTGIIAACRAKEMAVLAIRVLAGGIIALGERPARVSMMTKETDAEIEEEKAQAALRALGDSYGTRAQAGIRFALACPDVSVALVGIGAPAHVDEALAAVEMGPLPEDALDKLEGLYETDFGRAEAG